jgi:hypothetical protein
LKSLVLTTIAKDSNSILQGIYNRAISNGCQVVQVLDLKSGSLGYPGVQTLTISDQEELEFDLASRLPFNSYSRKNLGYLIAIANRSEWIIETDDDNIPSDDFFKLDSYIGDMSEITTEDWFNVYHYFGGGGSWPRGYPLERIKSSDQYMATVSEFECLNSPIFQVLADSDPDVDAIYRLTRELPIVFNSNPPARLSKGVVSPFNSQATWWRQDVFALLYFPSLISWRAADIWRSFIATRILQSNGSSVTFFPALVKQIRNEHSLLLDFKQEIECYLHNDSIWKALSAIPDHVLAGDFTKSLRTCYLTLIEFGYIPETELVLLDAWITDYKTLDK